MSTECTGSFTADRGYSMAFLSSNFNPDKVKDLEQRMLSPFLPPGLGHETDDLIYIASKWICIGMDEDK